MKERQLDCAVQTELEEARKWRKTTPPKTTDLTALGSKLGVKTCKKGKRALRYELLSDDHGGYVARCLDAEVASEGGTKIEAAENLREALELFFDCDEVELSRCS